MTVGAVLRTGTIRALAVVVGMVGARVLAGTPAPFEAGVLEVTLRFSAADEHGDPVDDLTASEVTVVEEGSPPLLPSTLRYERTGVAVALVIDSSESMTYRMADAIGGAKDFVRLLGDDDEVVAIDFDSQVRVLGQFGAERGVLIEALAGMEAGGATLLYDALARAEDLLAARPGGRAIVLLSDGEDGSFQGGSSHDLGQIMARARAAAIEVHTVGVGLAVNRFELEELADSTGGTHSFVEDSAALARIYRRIPRDLTEGYTLTYSSPNPAHDGTFRKVELRVKRPGVTLRTRPGYQAPGEVAPAP